MDHIARNCSYKHVLGHSRVRPSNRILPKNPLPGFLTYNRRVPNRAAQSKILGVVSAEKGFFSRIQIGFCRKTILRPSRIAPFHKKRLLPDAESGDL